MSLAAFALVILLASAFIADVRTTPVAMPSSEVAVPRDAGPALVRGPSTSDTADSAPDPSASAEPVATAVAAQSLPGAALSIGYRIYIARLGIDLPIAEGNIKRDTIDQRTPEGYAFHLPGTSLPGHAGNTYLYAHARVGMFLSLWNARVGDEVVVTAPGGVTLVYVVREVRPRVAPADVSVAGDTADERLTLQTSTGPNPQDPRFVVIAFPRGRRERSGDNCLVM